MADEEIQAAEPDPNYREGAYLDDGLYRCDNPNCELGEGPGHPGFFTGGGFVPDADTNEPVWRGGFCPTCKQEGVKVDAQNLGIE